MNAPYLFIWHAGAVKKSLDHIVIERLKAEMLRAGHSANSLAKRCRQLGYRTNQTTISAILRGRQSARVETLEKIASVLDIDAWLLLAEPGTIESILARSRPSSVHSNTPASVHQLEQPYGPILKVQGHFAGQPAKLRKGTSKHRSRKTKSANFS